MNVNSFEYAVPKDGSKKYVQLNLLAVDFITDGGWIMSSDKKQELVTYEKSNLDYIDKSNDDSFFLTTICMSGAKTIYKRQHQKIQDVLAQVSGTLGFFTIIFALLGFPCAQNYMHKQLVDDTYRIV